MAQQNHVSPSAQNSTKAAANNNGTSGVSKPAVQLFQAPVQRIAWHEKESGTAAVKGGAVPPIASLTSQGLTAIDVSGLTFNGHRYVKAAPVAGATKLEVLTGAAAFIGSVRFPESEKFLKKSQLTGIPINASIAAANIDGTITNKNRQNTYKGGIDPFIAEVPGKINSVEDIILHYQFGKDSYGYIVKIEQEGITSDMHNVRGQNALHDEQEQALKAGTQVSPLYSKFSSGHDTTDGNKISEIASQPIAGLGLAPLNGAVAPIAHDNPFVTGSMANFRERSKRLDAVAKIGGEGPRWQCVRAHAANLNNSSKFYTENPGNSTEVIYVTFQTLWGMWADTFRMRFNIPDAEVITAITRIWNAGGGGGRVQSMAATLATGDDYRLTP